MADWSEVLVAVLELTMTKADLMKWGRSFSQKRDAVSPFDLVFTATDDYASFRCLLSYGMLSNSLVLAAQAIEKFLKAHLLIDYDGAAPKPGHNLTKAAALLKSHKPGAKSLKLYSFLMDVYDFNRYPDNTDKILKKYGGRFSQDGAIIAEVDEEVFGLMDSLPAAPEVRYRSYFYTSLFSEQHNRASKTGHLISMKNAALLKNEQRYREEYLQVFYFHYPTLKPKAP